MLLKNQLVSSWGEVGIGVLPETVFNDVVLSYTNEDNPFGDEKLLDTFVWRKKMDKDGQSHLTETEQRRLIQSKQVELTKDLEKVKTARLAREEERAVREREKDNEIREQDAMRFKQWSKQEETFHLEQARLRSKIRIKDGRATTIDLLARYLDVLEGNESTPDTELHEPYVYMNGLNKTELEDLAADILVILKSYLSYHKRITPIWKKTK